MKSQHFFWVKKSAFFHQKCSHLDQGHGSQFRLPEGGGFQAGKTGQTHDFDGRTGELWGFRNKMAICHGDVWLGCFIGRYHEQCSRSWFLSFTRKERISLWRWWTKWWAMPSPCRAPRLPAVHHQTLEKSWVFHNLGMGDFTPPFCWWFTPVVGLKDGRQFQHINKKNQQNRQNTSY